MTSTTLSNLKVLTALSFYSILLVFSNLMILPMFFTLMLGLGSIVSGDLSGFIFSCLGLMSSGYLIASALFNKRKIHYFRTGLSLAILVCLAIYGIVESNLELPIYSWISYLFFFVCLLFCLFGLVWQDTRVKE